MNWEGDPAGVKVEGCDPGDSRGARLQAIPDPRWICSHSFLFKGHSHHSPSRSQKEPGPKDDDHHENADGHSDSLDDFLLEVRECEPKAQSPIPLHADCPRTPVRRRSDPPAWRFKIAQPDAFVRPRWSRDPGVVEKCNAINHVTVLKTIQSDRSGQLVEPY